MPLFRANGKLYLYAHVPKCAGSSVEDYLETRFGSLALCQKVYTALPEAQRWSKTSPQHISFADLKRLVPTEWIAGSFAVVRHPVGRVVSAYHFQRDVERTVDPEVSIEAWLSRYLDTREETPYQFDNHLMPQSDFVPDEAAVFHLEHGVDRIIPWLDRVAGDQSGPREIGQVNKAKDGGAKAAPSDELLEMIEKVYAADFKRFNYGLGERMPQIAPAEELPAIRQLPARQRPSAAKRMKRNIKRTLGIG